ncbi:MAG TPA: hypothetical protein VKO43_04505 [Candidatus Krumholzibacteriaceae bacterium]|nr:hypothetical protein [Candidatus Krumholzibacteriaceae bacterium]
MLITKDIGIISNSLYLALLKKSRNIRNPGRISVTIKVIENAENADKSLNIFIII